MSVLFISTEIRPLKDAFPQSRKASARCVMFVGPSVGPSVHIYQRGSQETVSFKFYIGNVYKSVKRLQIWLKSWGLGGGILAFYMKT
jgi:hypothetical protein